jgi:hypothetical protein
VDFWKCTLKYFCNYRSFVHGEDVDDVQYEFAYLVVYGRGAVEDEITIPNTITICQTISIQCYKTQSKGHFKISERIAIEERGS